MKKTPLSSEGVGRHGIECQKSSEVQVQAAFSFGSLQTQSSCHALDRPSCQSIVLNAKTLERWPPHTFRFVTFVVEYSRLPTQPGPDPVRPASCALIVGFALAAIRKPMAVSTSERLSAAEVKNCDASAASRRRTQEPGPPTAIVAGGPIQSDRVIAIAIGQDYARSLCPRRDRRQHIFVATPVAEEGSSRREHTFALQPAYVEHTVVCRRGPRARLTVPPATAPAQHPSTIPPKSLI